MSTPRLETDDKQILNGSIKDLVTSLNSQIHQLQSFLKCRNTKMSSDDQEELMQIEKRISSLESKVCTMDETIRKEEESLIFLKRMSECLDLQNNKLSYISDHLPTELPYISEKDKVQTNALYQLMNKTQSTHSLSPITQQMQQSMNIKQKKSNKRKAMSSLTADPRAIKRRKKHESNVGKTKEIPQLEIVGKDEFECVPKYMKGRLAQKRLNESINEFNQVLMAKYRLMQINPSKMGKSQFELHEKYLKKETSETKHLNWLCHEDLKDSKNFTFDQTGKAILNVMRHLKRIKMIAGKNPKYSVL